MLVLITASCIDRITFPLEAGIPRVVISGRITTDPGPYLVKVSQSLDIQNPFEFVKPLSVRHIVLIDNVGNVDTMKWPVDGPVGEYYSPPNGMRGTPGRAYKIRFETRDGSIYESRFDTLPLSNGQIDSVYTSFERREKKYDPDPTYHYGEEDYTYGFNVQFTTSGVRDDIQYLFNLDATYQVETIPSLNRIPCPGLAPDCPPNSGNCGCLSPLPCSNETGPNGTASCACCTCWVTINNAMPVLPDLKVTGLDHISAGFVSLTPYTFMFKVHAQIEQLAISNQTHQFFKEILAQQESKESLFQPVTGKINGNIVQISGPPLEAEGIFYATSISSNAIFILPEEIPDRDFIPKIDPGSFAGKRLWGSCLDFPKSTNTRPSFWID